MDDLKSIIESTISDYKEFPDISKTYNAAVNRLLKNVKASTKLAQIRNLFENFLNKYTMIPQLWSLWIELEEIEEFPDFEILFLQQRKKEIIEKSEKHFLLDVEINVEVEKIKRKLYRLKIELPNSLSTWEDLNNIQKSLTFPHQCLPLLMGSYMNFSTCPLSPNALKTYGEAIKLHAEIINSEMEGDEGSKLAIKKWFECLTKWTDDQFLIDNVEYRLGNEPNNRKLWKLYFSYFKMKNDKKVLDIYFRYCRLFNDDMEAKKEFRNVSDILEALPSSANDSEEDSVMEETKTSFNWKSIQNFKAGGKPQSFSLPSPMIYYIFQKGSFELRQSFYQSCKYFYFNHGQKQPICHRLFVGRNVETEKGPKFVNQSLNISPNYLKSKMLKKFIITNCLYVDPTASISLLLSNIQLNQNLARLFLISQYLTIGELSLLSKLKLKRACFYDVHVICYTDIFSSSSFDHIIKAFLHVADLSITSFSYSPTTTKKLAELKPIKSVRNLQIVYVPITFDANEFVIFLLKNCEKHSYVSLTFLDGIPKAYKTEFKKVVEANAPNIDMHVND